MAQLDFNALKKQIEDAGLSAAAFEAEFTKIKNAGGDVTKVLKTMQATVDGINDTARDIVGSFTDLSAQLKANLAELGKTNSALSISKKSYQGITSVVDKLKNEEQGIYDFNVKQLKSLQEKARVGYDDLRRSVQQLTAEERATEAGKAMLKARRAGYEVEKEALKAIERRLELEKKVEKTVGATGAILDTTSKLFGKLGFGHLSSELDELNKKLKDELREEISRSNGAAANLATSFKYVGKAIGGSVKILTEGLRDPLVILQFITAELLKGSQNMADFRKQTGMSYESAYKLNMEMKGVAAASGDNFITSEKLNKSFAMLTQQLGVSADILGGEALVSATNLEQRLGMSAEQASKLTVFSRLQGKNTEDILSKSTKIVGAYNKQNKTAINTRAVLDDVADTSNATYLTMGKNVEALTQAATQARALGLSMKQVEQISESMLNFEDSIGKELEAQLLTGGNINLAKAREHALTGDMVGLTNEIQKQEGIMTAFKTKNVIAQKAAADALGISREELAGMALATDYAQMSAEKFKDAYGETTYESMKSRSASEKFADAIEKVKDILGSIIQVFSPILDILAGILNIPLVPYILAGVVAVKALGFSVSGVGKAFGSMFSMGKQAITGLVGLFKKGALMSALGGLKNKLVGGFGVGTGDMVQAKSGKFYGKDSPQGKMISNLSGKTSEAADAAKKVPGKTGGGMSSLTDTIQKIKPSQLLAGGAALIMVAAAVYIFAKAAQEFATVSWEDMAKAGVGLLGLVAALALVGSIMMSGVGALAILAGAAAIVIMAGGLFILGKALQEIGKGMALMVPALALVSSIGDKAAGLATVGASLLGIADGLREIGSAGTGAIPVLQELNKLSGVAVSAGGKTAGAAKGKAEEGSMAAVAQKMDVLIELARKGTVVMLDGKVLATSNAQNQKQVLSNQR
jgi:hypothetical protein